MKYEPVIQSEMLITGKIQTKEIEVESKKLTGGGAVTGSLSYFFGKTCPNGYLVCNGAEVSIETYQELYEIIGTIYGAGSTSDKFKLPDLIDRFPQGHTTVGTVKEAGLPNITAAMSGFNSWIYKNLIGAFIITGTGSHNVASLTTYNNTTTYASWNFDASRCSTIYGSSTTVQPPALTLLPCIKY